MHEPRFGDLLGMHVTKEPPATVKTMRKYTNRVSVDGSGPGNNSVAREYLSLMSKSRPHVTKDHIRGMI
jgi:hypothetical protein